VITLIREDYQTYWKDATKPGFKALVVYRLNSWRASIPSRALRLPLSLVFGAAFRWIRNHYGIELPHTAVIGHRFTIIHQGGIVVHRYATIGDDCQILHGATLGAAGEMTRESAPRVGNGVQIGAGAMIIGKVTIGDGAKIGPNAVILSDVPAGATAFATPARIIYPPQPADAAADAAADATPADAADA
jgi:serine O-acetyltransferase